MLWIFPWPCGHKLAGFTPFEQTFTNSSWLNLKGWAKDLSLLANCPNVSPGDCRVLNRRVFSVCFCWSVRPKRFFRPTKMVYNVVSGSCKPNHSLAFPMRSFGSAINDGRYRILFPCNMFEILQKIINVTRHVEYLNPEVQGIQFICELFDRFLRHDGHVREVLVSIRVYPKGIDGIMGGVSQSGCRESRRVRPLISMVIQGTMTLWWIGVDAHWVRMLYGGLALQCYIACVLPATFNEVSLCKASCPTGAPCSEAFVTGLEESYTLSTPRAPCPLPGYQQLSAEMPESRLIPNICRRAFVMRLWWISNNIFNRFMRCLIPHKT